MLGKEVDYAGEEGQMVPVEAEQPPPDEERNEADGGSAEKMEEVLNQGMSFISSLLEMATGQKLAAAEGREKMVTLDKKTGEVTLKFTLPGFGRVGQS